MLSMDVQLNLAIVSHRFLLLIYRVVINSRMIRITIIIINIGVSSVRYIKIIKTMSSTLTSSI